MSAERPGGGEAAEEKKAAEMERRPGYRHVEHGPDWTLGLEVQPGLQLTKEAFVNRYRRTVAVDGVVKHDSFRDPRTLNVNLDHHGGEDPLQRAATLATCEQALEVVREGRRGMLNLYRDRRAGAQGKIEFSVLAEDCDPDVALTYFIFRLRLQQPEIFDPGKDPVLREKRLRLEGMVKILANMDKNGGYYRDEITAEVEECCWAVSPFFEARDKNLIETMDGKGMDDLIQEMCRRFAIIVDRAEGQLPGRKPFTGSYETISEFSTYDGPEASRIAFVREIDSQGAKTEAFGVNGLDVMVSVFPKTALVGGREVQLYVYKFNVGGAFVIDYPGLRVYEKLNAHIRERNKEWQLPWLETEGVPRSEHTQTAGGAPTSGGGPKEGIPVPPAELEALMKTWLAEFHAEKMNGGRPELERRQRP